MGLLPGSSNLETFKNVRGAVHEVRLASSILCLIGNAANR